MWFILKRSEGILFYCLECLVGYYGDNCLNVCFFVYYGYKCGNKCECLFCYYIYGCVLIIFIYVVGMCKYEWMFFFKNVEIIVKKY